MYKICGFTNYECNCGEEQILGKNLNYSDAISLYATLAQNANSLDFTELDTLIDEWASDCGWEEDDYYAGSYGGSIILFDEAINDGDFDREIVITRITRDPLRKISEISESEFGPDITTAEKDQYLRSK